MKSYNHRQFFEYEQAHGMTPDHLPYRDLHYSLGRKIKQDLNPKSVLEIGCGSGALLEWFCSMDIEAYGIDNNPHHKEYFSMRNPDCSHAYMLWDLKNKPTESFFDVIVSIECFEHLEDKVLAQTADYVSRNCNYFVFSSTPHPDPDFDIQWGHVNVKNTDEWIEFFNRRDLKLKERWDVPTEWTLVFER